jgi:hypothetical protein
MHSQTQWQYHDFADRLISLIVDKILDDEIAGKLAQRNHFRRRLSAASGAFSQCRTLVADELVEQADVYQQLPVDYPGRVVRRRRQRFGRARRRSFDRPFKYKKEEPFNTLFYLDRDGNEFAKEFAGGGHVARSSWHHGVMAA